MCLAKWLTSGDQRMQATLASVITTLVLSLSYAPVLAQTSSTVPALRSMSMLDALSGWAVTDQPDAWALLRTTDGGLHWTDVTPLDSSGQRVSVGDLAVLTPLIAWVLSFHGFDFGPLFHTADGGKTWSSGIAPPILGSVDFIDAQNGWGLYGVGAAGSMEADIYRSTDAGATWTKVASTTADNESSGLPFGGDKGDVTFLNATTGWVTGTVGVPDVLYLYVTHDGGYTWQQQQLSLPPGLTSRWFAVTTSPQFFTANDGVLPVFYGSEDPATGAAVGAVAVFYITHDGGTTWTSTTPLSVSDVWTPLSSFTDVNHGWIADGDVLYVTTDGGSHWTAIPPTPLFANVKQIDFISPQVGWALTPASLLKTEDGGLTWAPVVYTILQ
jgi:photosystem II stability/assembly factor-like uncharacterized protein